VEIVAVVVVAVLAIGLTVLLRGGAEAAGIAAPRLSPDFAATLLGRAGFPVDAHNVAALSDRLGVAFLAAVRDPAGDSWAALAARCEATRHDAVRWPQRVLEEIAAAGHQAVSSLPQRCPDALLATVGTGHGFFGGSLFAPLPLPGAARPAQLAAVPAPRVAAAAGDLRAAV